MNARSVKISIIFPSYNGEKVITDCLNSIEALDNHNEVELVVCDNNSKDSTKDLIKKFKKININLIELDSNVGYAKACNICVARARGEFIFITNQDIVFPTDFFKILLNLYAKKHNNEEIIISPAIVFPGRRINYFGAKIHFLGFSYTPKMYLKITNKKITFKTLKASGCSMFLKRKTFVDLKGFDSYFFMYHEDTDFSLKALRNNIKIYTTNETTILHKKLHMLLNDFTYYYIERNRYLVLYKNIEKIRSLFPFLVISEVMLFFQAIIARKLKLRLFIYKFLLKNYPNIKKLRFNEFNAKTKKLKIKNLSKNFDPIILGRILSNVKILRYFLRIINIIL